MILPPPPLAYGLYTRETAENCGPPLKLLLLKIKIFANDPLKYVIYNIKTHMVAYHVANKPVHVPARKQEEQRRDFSHTMLCLLWLNRVTLPWSCLPGREIHISYFSKKNCTSHSQDMNDQRFGGFPLIFVHFTETVIECKDIQLH